MGLLQSFPQCSMELEQRDWLFSDPGQSGRATYCLSVTASLKLDKPMVSLKGEQTLKLTNHTGAAPCNALECSDFFSAETFMQSKDSAFPKKRQMKTFLYMQTTDFERCF